MSEATPMLMVTKPQGDWLLLKLRLSTLRRSR
jgi:hypothetical protein